MGFYIMEEPNYGSDIAFARNNPVVQSSDFWLPLLHCDQCGKTWGGDGSLYIAQEDKQIVKDYIKTKLNIGEVLEYSEWYQIAKEISKLISIDVNYLRPTMSVGPPMGTLRNIPKHHILFPAPRHTWITERLKKMLEDEEVTGVKYHEVQLSYGPKVKDITEITAYYEIEILNTSFRKGTKLEDVFVCGQCNRKTYPKREMIIDASRINGYDMNIIDYNSAYVLVSEKVKNIFSSAEISNVIFKEVPVEV